MINNFNDLLNKKHKCYHYVNEYDLTDRINAIIKRYKISDMELFDNFMDTIRKCYNTLGIDINNITIDSYLQNLSIYLCIYEDIILFNNIKKNGII